MKKSSLISIIVLLALFGGWYYIKNYTRLLTKTISYYGFYDNVKGLQSSDPVYLQGVKVGKVDDVELMGDQKVKVYFAIDKHMEIPAGTKAIIGSGELTGSKTIRLLPGTGAVLPPESRLETGIDSSLMENFHAKVTPMLHNGKYLLRSFDSGLNEFNLLLTGGWGRQTQADIAKFNKTTENLERGARNANQSVGGAHAVIEKLDSMTTRPGKRNSSTNKALAGAEDNTQKLSRTEVNKNLSELQSSMRKLDKTFSKVKANKIVSDRTDYEKAAKKLDTIRQNLDEIKNNPKGISLLGGKKK